MEETSTTEQEAFKPGAKAQVEAIMGEKMKLDGYNFPIANKLLSEELSKVMTTKSPSPDRRFINLLNNKPIKLDTKIQVPALDFPHINFVGKLLGFGGETLKHLQELTKCRIFISGKGSMRNKEKEEALLRAGDPKYSHLTDILHIQVTAFAPPIEAYTRMTHAISLLQHFLMPDETVDFDVAAQKFALANPSEVHDFIEKARHSMGWHPTNLRKFNNAHTNGRFSQRGAKPRRGVPYSRRNPNLMN